MTPLSPGGDLLALTRPGEVGLVEVDPDGSADLAATDWIPAGDWSLAGWAAPTLLALRRRGELGLLDTDRRMLTSSHPVVGRTLRYDGEEALIAVVRDGRPMLCAHRPDDGSYRLLDGTEGVRSVAAWDRNTLVFTSDRGVTLIQDGERIELDAVSAAGEGPLVALTGEGEVPGVLDIATGRTRWFTRGGGGIAVSPSGLLLTMAWTDHRYVHRVLDRDGHIIGTPVPGHGIATDLAFTADERHLLGRHQSPAASPALVRWNIHSGRMRALPGRQREEITVRWQHRESAQSPEWLYEPENGHGGVVLHLHGGPRSQLRQIHEPMIAALVDAGWTVIGMNYPGSSGYGDEFRDVVVGDWGGADVAAVIARLRELRGDRPLCLYGQSYGAYLALLAAAPDLVDAVAVWAPVTDLNALLESATGLHRQWLRTELGALADDPDELRERSPIHRPFAAPRLMIGHSEGDDRVPVGQSRAFVERLGAERYVEQQGNGHEPADMAAWTAAVVAHLADLMARVVREEVSA
ncbi:alpha/beta fold hydrolase [Lentzea sp. BCCO 10_0061]|uniref:Alpha/beta fold hydrolase n=1 Tax=Lentzea sokolovensis TaxID=3095429 RepID=A0ABU4US85_9PSEU|nr:alpha/beta fold hydrolase [Lentzea sp. BCCO 10_0061]MDX8142140.1 alpha/beta fold hydrolase [Lentzea sp. BCCO 10_0061]